MKIPPKRTIYSRIAEIKCMKKNTVSILTFSFNQDTIPLTFFLSTQHGEYHQQLQAGLWDICGQDSDALLCLDR